MTQREAADELQEDPAAAPTEVLFFGTCLIGLLAPEAGLAAMRLIERADVRVRFAQDKTCCGQPAYNPGFRQPARAVAGTWDAALGRGGIGHLSGFAQTARAETVAVSLLQCLEHRQ